MPKQRTVVHKVVLSHFTPPRIPDDAVPLTAQMQYGQPTLWYLTNPSTPAPKTREVSLVGTGHDVPENCDWAGTVQEENGALVWHVFVERPYA